jgi:hypothetical protein
MRALRKPSSSPPTLSANTIQIERKKAMPKVKFEKSVTVQLKQYHPVTVSFGLEMECPVDKLEDTKELVIGAVEEIIDSKMNQLVSEGWRY